MTASKIVMPNTWADFVFEFGFAFGFPRVLLPLFTVFCDDMRSAVVAVTASDTNSTSDDEDDDEDDDDSDVGGVNGVICGFTSIDTYRRKATFSN